MKYIIDRIEENQAVLQDEQEKCLILPLEKLPVSISPGDVIIRTGDAYTTDVEQTRLRRDHIRRLEERLRNR